MSYSKELQSARSPSYSLPFLLETIFLRETLFNPESRRAGGGKERERKRVYTYVPLLSDCMQYAAFVLLLQTNVFLKNIASCGLTDILYGKRKRKEYWECLTGQSEGTEDAST